MFGLDANNGLKITAVSYWQKKVLILPLLDALSSLTGYD